MTIQLLIAMLLASPSPAQLIACPQLFPEHDVLIGSADTAHRARARVRRAHLSYAYMFFGELFEEQTLVGPEPKPVVGGWDSTYFFSTKDTNWLVCRYGGSSWGTGDIEMWQQLPSATVSCVLQVRELKEPHVPTRWAATASCQGK